MRSHHRLMLILLTTRIAVLASCGGAGDQKSSARARATEWSFSAFSAFSAFLGGSRRPHNTYGAPPTCSLFPQTLYTAARQQGNVRHRG